MAWKRYKDPESGAEFTVDEVAGVAMGLDPLTEDDGTEKVAADINGRPLAFKPAINLAGEERTAAPSKSWRVAELQSYAAGNGIEVADDATKADIIAAIEAASNSEGEES